MSLQDIAVQRRQWIDVQHPRLIRIYRILQRFYHFTQINGFELPADFHMALIYAAKYDERFANMVQTMLDKFPLDLVESAFSDLIGPDTISETTVSETLPHVQQFTNIESVVCNTEKSVVEINLLDLDSDSNDSQSVIIDEESAVKIFAVDSDLSDSIVEPESSPWSKVHVMTSENVVEPLHHDENDDLNMAFHEESDDFDLNEAFIHDFSILTNVIAPTPFPRFGSIFGTNQIDSTITVSNIHGKRTSASIDDAIDLHPIKKRRYVGKCYDSVHVLTKQQPGVTRKLVDTITPDQIMTLLERTTNKKTLPALVKAYSETKCDLHLRSGLKFRLELPGMTPRQRQ